MDRRPSRRQGPHLHPAPSPPPPPPAAPSKSATPLSPSPFPSSIPQMARPSSASWKMNSPSPGSCGSLHKQRRLPAGTHPQLIDTDSHRTVFGWEGEDGNIATGITTQAPHFFAGFLLSRRVGKIVTRWELLTSNLVIGSHPIDIAGNLGRTYKGARSLRMCSSPKWIVVVSKPSRGSHDGCLPPRRHRRRRRRCADPCALHHGCRDLQPRDHHARPASSRQATSAVGPGRVQRPPHLQ